MEKPALSGREGEGMIIQAPSYRTPERAEIERLESEREKLIGTLEWAIKHIISHQHYYFLNIHASDKEALKQARAVLQEIKR